jgi:hypothetical protein
MSSDEFPDAQWNDKLEEYFSSLGEVSHCNFWLHNKAEALFTNRKVWIDIPVIVLSALIGFANVGSSTLFNDQRIASISLGAVSLFVSILNSTGSYFNWSKRAEAHRLASIDYAKLYRFLLVEMSFPRTERTAPPDLLKYTKDAIDRLAELSPIVPLLMIAEFNKKFNNDKYKDVSKPEITNGLEAIYVYKENPLRQTAVPEIVVSSPVSTNGDNTSE